MFNSTFSFTQFLQRIANFFRNIEWRPGYIISIVVIAGCVVMMLLLWRSNKKQEKQRDEQQAIIDEAARPCSMLVIDKKKVRLKDADLPQEIKDNTPWYGKRAKVPVVKVKVGPKVMNMIADNDIFDLIPVKKEIKAFVAGIYITDVRGLRTGLEKRPQKRRFLSRIFGQR